VIATNNRYLKSKDADIPATIAVGLSSDIIPKDAGSSFADVNFYNLPGENSWPITMMSYFYVRKDLTSIGSAGPLLKVRLGSFYFLILKVDAQHLKSDNQTGV